jgi:low temperature requirement protein LtrA
MAARWHGGLLRDRAEGPAEVRPIELFFDLVYVLAVTQLTHHLLEHLSVRGAFQTLLLLMAVWWAWIDTAWFTNWFDPDRRAVRLVLLVIMLISLIMSATLPEAFDDRGFALAAALAVMQAGRAGFAVRSDVAGGWTG